MTWATHSSQGYAIELQNISMVKAIPNIGNALTITLESSMNLEDKIQTYGENYKY